MLKKLIIKIKMFFFYNSFKCSYTVEMLKKKFERNKPNCDSVAFFVLSYNDATKDFEISEIVMSGNEFLSLIVKMGYIDSNNFKLKAEWVLKFEGKIDKTSKIVGHSSRRW